MGRHGKNIQKPLTAPVARPEYNGVPRIEQLLTDYQKQMLTDDVRSKLYEQALASVLAVTARVLVYHTDDIVSTDVDERLDMFYKLFLRYYEGLAEPDVKQRFAEWYWEISTGYDLIRQEDLEDKKVAKEQQDKLAAKLKAHIEMIVKQKKTTVNDIIDKANVKAGKYYNCLGAKYYNKETFDAIAEAVGFEMDEETTRIYKARFESKRGQEENTFTEMAAELENAAKKQQKEEKVEELAAPEAVSASVSVENAKEDKSIAEEVSEAPSPVSVEMVTDEEALAKAKSMVLDMVETAVEELAAEKESDFVPHKDCNDFYRENAEEKKEEVETMSHIDILNKYISKCEAEKNDVEKEKAEVLAVISDLKTRLEELDKKEAAICKRMGVYANCVTQIQEVEA